MTLKFGAKREHNTDLDRDRIERFWAARVQEDQQQEEWKARRQVEREQQQGQREATTT